MQQIAVCAVQLDDVHAGLVRAPRRLRESVGDDGDVRDRHGARQRPSFEVLNRARRDDLPVFLAVERL